MTAIANARLTDNAGLVPGRGTISAAANQLFHRMTIVSENADGRAVVPSDGDGFNAAGVASVTVDNRTGSEAGGLNDSIEVECHYGIHGFDFVSGDGTPRRGKVVYVVDNQTVSASSDGGQRGIAGICTEVRLDSTGALQCYVLFGPLALALVDILGLAAAYTDAAIAAI